MATKKSTSSNGTFAKYESKNSQYNKSLSMYIKGSTRLYGAPHQLLPHNDPRVGSAQGVNGLGKIYAEKIVLEAPIVCIKPGKSVFMPGTNSTMKNGMLNALGAAIEGNYDDIRTIIEQESSSDDIIKYFGFQQDFSGFMTNANLLCRFMAYFLGVSDVRVPWAPHVNFGHYDWRYYKFKKTMDTESDEMGSNGKGIGHFITDAFESVQKSLSEDDSYISFYVDSNVSFSESGSNSTSQSVLTQFTDSLSSMAKELQTVSNISGFDAQGLTGSVTSSLDSYIQKAADGNNPLSTFLRRLTGTTNQIVQGANFLVPEVWSDSSWTTSYSVPITLVTPYGNKLSWYLNIGVPLCFILALALPHESTANTFTTPNLVQCFSQGWFNCDMGIIDGISIDKGGDDCWNAAGLPNEIKVSLSIKDLYSSLTLPKSDNALGFMQNTSMLQFLLVNSGVDLTVSNMSDHWKLWKFMFADTLTSKVQSAPYDKLLALRNKVNSMAKLLK